METTFYDDQMYSSKEQMKSLKRNMKLDFNSKQAAKKQKYNNILLSSPDLNMLKLASPELEKLIIQQNGFVTTTPTPTQMQMFSKTITEEQENYAKGFVDALAELHSSFNPATIVTTIGSNGAPAYVNAVSLPQNTTSILLPVAGSNRVNGPFVAPHPPPVTTSSSGFINLQTVIKEEPQTVPSLSSTPPLSPIDMESQERIKLERKRQRNRVAASKCRRRKLERISRLEDRVRQLKGENSELANAVNKLRETICLLKEEVMDHAKNGCQIMVSQY